jgi:hypothetical protein
MHERAETLVVTRVEGALVLLDQRVKTGGVAGIDEFENRHARDY